MLVQLHATLTNYRSMYILFSLLAIMIVVMTGVIPHAVPPHWQINDPVFIVPLGFLVGGHLLAPLVSLPSRHAAFLIQVAGCEVTAEYCLSFQRYMCTCTWPTARLRCSTECQHPENAAVLRFNLMHRSSIHQ